MDPKNGTKNVVYDNHRYNAFVRSILLNSVSNDKENSFDIPKTIEMLKKCFEHAQTPFNKFQHCLTLLKTHGKHIQHRISTKSNKC